MLQARTAREGAPQELIASVEEAGAAIAAALGDAKAHTEAHAALEAARLDFASSLRDDIVDEEGEAAHLTALLPGLRDAFDAFNGAYGLAQDTLVCDAGATASTKAEEVREAEGAIEAAIDDAEVELLSSLKGLDTTVKHYSAGLLGHVVAATKAGAVLPSNLIAAEAAAKECQSKAVSREVKLHSRIEVSRPSYHCIMYYNEAAQHFRLSLAFIAYMLCVAGIYRPTGSASAWFSWLEVAR